MHCSLPGRPLRVHGGGGSKAVWPTQSRPSLGLREVKQKWETCVHTVTVSMGVQGVMGPDSGGYGLPQSARCLAGPRSHRSNKTPQIPTVSHLAQRPVSCCPVAVTPPRPWGGNPLPGLRADMTPHLWSSASDALHTWRTFAFSLGVCFWLVGLLLFHKLTKM